MADLDVTAAVEALRPLVLQARAAYRLGEQLENLVGLEGYQKELELEIQQLRAAIVVLKSEQDKAKNDGLAIRLAAKEAAEETLSQGREQASVIVEAADRIKKNAEQDASNILAQITAGFEELETLQQTKNEFEISIAELLLKKQDIEEEIESLLSKLTL